MKKKEAGKGSWPPRNVGKNFHKNFPDIDWHGRDAKSPDKVTSTAKIYSYSKSSSLTLEKVQDLRFLVPCPMDGCDNGGVDSGGFTPYGSPITVACDLCKGTGKITQEEYDAMLKATQ